MSERTDGRSDDQLREVSFKAGFQSHPAGSVLVTFGGTRVICSASVDESVPRWMAAKNEPGGWITAEYQMLPGSTHTRVRREREKISGRSSEIQRLVGRSLRAAVDLTKLPGLTITVDCDVLDADGGTRCASITGGCVALEIALQKLFTEGRLKEWPLLTRVAAVSVGVLEGRSILDLCYEEDSAAEVDMNVVMTGTGEFVEVQGTAEDRSFSRSQLDAMLDLAQGGLTNIFALQKAAVIAAAEC
ncbi:MAG: ribonuclease PH [Lentisphaeria bacterium]|nr:ribonuclease PH [Lentisphaeria bacterium]